METKTLTDQPDNSGSAWIRLVLGILGGFPLMGGLWVAQPAFAETPAAIETFSQESMAACRSAGGSPKLLDSFLTPTGDLNGDEVTDYVTDLAGLECVNAWSYFCGSAGCPVTVWLSGPEGFTVGWGGSAQQWKQRGREIVVSMHGQLCKPPRIGAQSCEVAMRFDRPQSPPAKAVISKGTSHPSPTGIWQLRQSGRGPGIASVDGVGRLDTLTALCLRDRPVMMARLTDEAGEPSLTFTFEFPDRTIEVSGVAGATTRKTYILDPRTSGLPEAMSGKVNAVNLRIGGQEQGMLSLSGSTRALLGALSSCLKFGD